MSKLPQDEDNPEIIFTQLCILGASLKPSWQDQVNSAKLTGKEILTSFLNLDISETSLPINVDLTKDHVKIEHPIILQINEIVDMSLPKEQRQKQYRSKSNALKCLLNDGKTCYVGFIEPSNDMLQPNMKAGLKISISPPVCIAHGIFILTVNQIHFLDDTNYGFSRRYANKLNEEVSKAQKREKENKQFKIQFLSIIDDSLSNSQFHFPAPIKREDPHYFEESDDPIPDQRQNQMQDIFSFPDEAESQQAYSCPIPTSPFQPMKINKQKMNDPDYLREMFQQMAQKGMLIVGSSQSKSDEGPIKLSDLYQLPSPYSGNIKVKAKVAYIANFSVENQQYNVRAMLVDDDGYNIEISVDPSYVFTMVGVSPTEYSAYNSTRQTQCNAILEEILQSLPEEITLVELGTENTGGRFMLTI